METDENDVEAICFRLKTHRTYFIVVEIYEFPMGNKNNVFSKLDYLLTDLTNRQQKCILTGNFNIGALNNK